MVHVFIQFASYVKTYGNLAGLSWGPIGVHYMVSM